MTNSIRDRIVQFTTLPVAHETAELGTVYIRRLTLGEIDAMQAENKVANQAHSAPVRLLARFIGDDKGVPVFDLTKTEDAAAIKSLPGAIAAELLRLGNKVNKLAGEDDEKNA